jgi:hypothetical protein
MYRVRLGPQLSGILTAFPVATVVIGVFTQVQRGHEPVTAFFRALIRGLHSFVLFCFVFSTALVRSDCRCFQALSRRCSLNWHSRRSFCGGCLNRLLKKPAT